MADDVDESRYPRLSEYLRALPDGLASYPECKAKGTLVTSAIEGHDLTGLDEGLPEEVVAMLHDPPAAGFWVPATMADAIFYVFTDRFYPTEEAVIQWTYDRTVRTAKSRLYRAFTRLTSPGMLLRIASASHRMFQRGTDLDVKIDKTSAILTLTHPPYLHGNWNRLVNVAMFRAMLETAGGLDPQAELTEASPTTAVYSVHWH